MTNPSDESVQGSHERQPEVGGDVIPLEPKSAAVDRSSGAASLPVARPSPVRAPISADSPENEPCPRCGRGLPPSAVVCVECGYDLAANVVRSPETGEVEVEPPAPAFIPAHPRATRPLLIAGGILTLAAMTLGGIAASSVGGSGFVIARVLLIVYLVLLHTATGAAAVIATAWLTGRRLGSLELATVRMLVTVSGFLLVLQIPDMGLPSWLAGGARWLLAAGVYFALMWGLFRRDRNETGMLAGAHALLWLLTSAGMYLAVWMSRFQSQGS